MSSETNILIQLKQYASGELHGQEREQLEARLANEPELRNELETTKALITATGTLEKERLLHLITKLQKEDAAVSNPAKEKRYFFQFPSLYFKLAWAMGIAVLLAFCIWLFFPAGNPLENFDQTAYIKPAVAGAALKGASQNKMTAAYLKFQTGKYGESNALIKDIPANDSLYLFSLFLQGHNYYRSEQYAESIVTFDQLMSLSTPGAPYYFPDMDNAGWTRILAIFSIYKKGNDPATRQELTQAIDAFKTTANQSDIYFEKAAALGKLLQE